MTAQEYQDYEKNKKQKPGKYKSIPHHVDGIRFDSRKEAEYYGQLKLRKKINDIKGFRRQVRFKMEIDGVNITTYVADFVIEHHDGREEVIDVKSEITKTLATYRIKKKLLLALHKIEVIEV